jgi:hypothetical protein
VGVLLAVFSLFDFIKGVLVMSEVDPDRYAGASGWLLLFLGQSGFYLAAIGATMLGWVAISQIRRSAGKLRGMKLAVFDGLLFPLLALNGLIGWIVWLVWMVASSITSKDFGYGSASTALVVLSSLPIAIPLTRYIIRRVWRAVHADSAAVPPAKPFRIIWASVWLGAIIATAVVAPFLNEQNLNQDAASLVNQPHKLRSLPNATVIQVGLADPTSPWAWKELQTRANTLTTGGIIRGVNLSLEPHEALSIVDGLSAWMRREHPQGYNQPLHWIGDLLDEFQPWIAHMGETNVLAFLEAYYGNPFLFPVPRIRENQTNLWLSCTWGSSWLKQHSLGFELLNEMRSISVDGRQVPANYVSGRNWNDGYYSARLQLPRLAPGKHVIRCEVDSAFVDVADLPGLTKDASSKDWPPAKRRWTRICEAEFMVYSEDAEIVRLTDEPELNPVASGALSCRQIIIRSENGRLTATTPFDVVSQVGRPISVNVALRIAGQTIPCGKLFDVQTLKPPMGTWGSGGDKVLTADIGALDAQIKEAEIILTPNPKRVEEFSFVDRIWGREIVISHVPLSRQDLYGARPVEAAPAAAPNRSFSPVIERVAEPDGTRLFGLISLGLNRQFALRPQTNSGSRFADIVDVDSGILKIRYKLVQSTPVGPVLNDAGQTNTQTKWALCQLHPIPYCAGE